MWRPIVVQDAESVRHLSVLRLKRFRWDLQKRTLPVLHIRINDFARFLLTMSKNSCISRKSNSSSGDTFWFPKDEGKTRKDFVFFPISIFLRIIINKVLGYPTSGRI